MNRLIFTWLLVLAVLLAACSPAPTSLPPTPPFHATGTPASGTADPAPSTARPAGTVTPIPARTLAPVQTLPGAGNLQGAAVQFWFGEQGPAAAALVSMAQQFSATNSWGVQVEAQNFLTLDDLSAQVASAQPDSLPVLVMAYPFQAANWGADEAPIDLSPYIQDPQWGLSQADLADFYPVFFDGSQPSGSQPGFPALTSGDLLYYNQTWAQELGFTSAPQTASQFKEQACAAAQANLNDDDRDNNGTGGYLVSTNYSAVLGWLHASGTRPYDTAQGTYHFDTPEVRQAFTFLRSLYDQGCAWQMEEPAPESEFAARRALFTSGSLRNLPFQAETMQQAGSADRWTVLPYPSDSASPAIVVYGPGFLILPSAPEKQLGAWLFVRWLASAENQAQLAAAASSFPLRVSAAEDMQDYAANHPHWAATLDLLQYAREEPQVPSWNITRWALSDAATQLFRYYFTIDQVPELTKLLDETANSLQRTTPQP